MGRKHEGYQATHAESETPTWWPRFVTKHRPALGIMVQVPHGGTVKPRVVTSSVEGRGAVTMCTWDDENIRFEVKDGSPIAVHFVIWP